ncbi:unnamed protein product, partial [Closterium sp. NIES-53]
EKDGGGGGWVGAADPLPPSAAPAAGGGRRRVGDLVLQITSCLPLNLQASPPLSPPSPWRGGRGAGAELRVRP